MTISERERKQIEALLNSITDESNFEEYVFTGSQSRYVVKFFGWQTNGVKCYSIESTSDRRGTRIRFGNANQIDNMLPTSIGYKAFTRMLREQSEAASSEKHRKKYELTMLADGDIEIYEMKPSGKKVRVRHRSFNAGDKLKQNLAEEFEAMEAMEELE
jgi:hypothetical protein